ncbi:MAG: ATP-binding protein [Bacteroidota bacterium]
MEIAVISGKGGTGKSSITAAFATIVKNIVLVDCDVDAANLHIIFNPDTREEQVYVGGQKAVIDPDLCTNCGLCRQLCRFNAIEITLLETIISDSLCDGCLLCYRVCPEKAISIIDNNKSRLYAGSFRNGEMVHGRLAPGEENSGKLVNLVRNKAKQISQNKNIDNILIDGPPGIGCPVISSITGVDKVVIVTEPSTSGMHDFKRAVEIASKFDLKSFVIINKSDLNSHITTMINDYCFANDIEVLGEIPYDSEIVNAMVNCKSIIEWAPKSETSQLLIEISNKIFNEQTL